jgi:hypothetical protein
MVAAGASVIPKTAKSLAEIVKEARQTTGSSSEAKLKIMDEIARLDTSALVELIRSATDSQSFFKGPSFEFQFAVNRLVELRPMDAAGLWVENQGLRVFAPLFLTGWTKKDPQAFASWVMTQTFEIQKAAAPSIGSLAKDEPDKFAELAPQLLQSPVARVGAQNAIAGMLEREGGAPEKALAYARVLPEGEVRNAALVELLKLTDSKLLTNTDVAAALGQVTPEEGYRLGRNLVKSAEQLPPGITRQSAFATALREDSNKDPAAAARRLESLAGTVDYAPAVLGFVEAVAPKDPAVAAEWALSINPSDPIQRSATLQRAASSWFKADPEAARAWVEKAPLTDKEFFMLTGRTREQ